MDNTTFIVITALAGVALIFGIIRIWKIRLDKKNIGDGNMSSSLFLGSQAITLALIFSYAFEEATLIKSLISQSSDNPMKLIEYLGIFILIVLFLYITLYILTNLTFRLLTPSSVDVFQEIKENNVSGIIILITVLIGFTIICAPFLPEIFMELIPDWEVPRMF